MHYKVRYISAIPFCISAQSSLYRTTVCRKNSIICRYVYVVWLNENEIKTSIKEFRPVLTYLYFECAELVNVGDC